MAYEQDIHSLPIVIKVQDGTVRSDTKTLCLSCIHGHVIRGRNNEQKIVCGRMMENGLLNFPVVECNMYQDKSKPSLHDMEDIAWMLVTKKSSHAIGFVDPIEFNKIRDKDKDRF